jgi:hypothetical protein
MKGWRYRRTQRPFFFPTGREQMRDQFISCLSVAGRLRICRGFRVTATQVSACVHLHSRLACALALGSLAISLSACMRLRSRLACAFARGLLAPYTLELLALLLSACLRPRSRLACIFALGLLSYAFALGLLAPSLSIRLRYACRDGPSSSLSSVMCAVASKGLFVSWIWLYDDDDNSDFLATSLYCWLDYYWLDFTCLPSWLHRGGATIHNWSAYLYYYSCTHVSDSDCIGALDLDYIWITIKIFRRGVK